MFLPNNLSVLAYAEGFTLWRYAAVHVHEVIETGFFDCGSDMIRPQDTIFVTGEGGPIMVGVVEAPEGWKTGHIVVKVMAAPLESAPGDPVRHFAQGGHAVPVRGKEPAR